MLTMFYFLHSLCVWKSQLSHLLKSAIRFKLSLTLVDDRLYLPISTLSSCRLICCRCAMSRGGPPISSPPHPQIAGYGGLSYCNQQQQHITPPPHPSFSQTTFSDCHHNMLNLGSARKKNKLPVNVSGSHFFGQDKEKVGKRGSLYSREWLVYVC